MRTAQDQMAQHSYDHSFMTYAAQSSTHAATTVTSHLSPLLGVASVLDVGCASGTWLHAWSTQGVTDLQGIDGGYVDPDHLEIDRAQFSAHDLNTPFDLGRQFDLVQSLEVAEHIDPQASLPFVECLARHAQRFILFSAAPPGQGGEFHVNERPYEFWRSALDQQGFRAVDAIRPAISADRRISYWYRYNMFLFVRNEVFDELPTSLSRFSVPPGQALADVSPLAFKVRKAMVSRVPGPLQSQIAKWKSRLFPTGRF